MVQCAVLWVLVSHSFSLFYREFTGKISVSRSFSDFYPLKPIENTVLFGEFPKKLTGNFISGTGNTLYGAGYKPSHITD